MPQTQLTSSETTGKQSGTVTEFNSSKTRQRMREFYETSETYKSLLDAHDETYLRHYVELVIRYAPAHAKVLDLGCGNGISAKLLNQADFDVVGTDLSPLFLKEARNWETRALNTKSAMYLSSLLIATPSTLSAQMN